MTTIHARLPLAVRFTLPAAAAAVALLAGSHAQAREYFVSGAGTDPAPPISRSPASRSRALSKTPPSRIRRWRYVDSDRVYARSPRAPSTPAKIRA